jgi:hypothetical protein
VLGGFSLDSLTSAPPLLLDVDGRLSEVASDDVSKRPYDALVVIDEEPTVSIGLQLQRPRCSGLRPWTHASMEQKGNNEIHA